MNAPCRGAVFVSGLLALGLSPRSPANPTFIRIADSGTLIPGSEQRFFLLATPSIDGEDVAFADRRLIGGGIVTTGIYKYVDGALQTVADRDTPIPGGTGTFAFFRSEVSISSGSVAFVGHGASGHEGIYTDHDGLSIVADSSTPIPGGSGDFSELRGIWLDQANVAFWGQSASGACGIYLFDNGSLSCIVDADTLIPPNDIESFTLVMFPALCGERVAFHGAAGYGASGGIYLHDHGSLTCIADDDTPIPEGSGTFIANGFGNPSVDHGGDIQFNAAGASDQHGVYRCVGGTLEKVVDRPPHLPGFKKRVTGFGGAGFDDDVAVFTVQCCGSPVGWDAAVYVDVRGHPCRIIGAGDTIEGRTVWQARVGRQCVSGQRIAFWISYDQGVAYANYVACFYPGDLDGDRDVDIADLAELLGHFGGHGARTEGDINGDGRIDAIDLEILLTHYGVTWPE